MTLAYRQFLISRALRSFLAILIGAVLFGSFSMSAAMSANLVRSPGSLHTLFPVEPATTNAGAITVVSCTDLDRENGPGTPGSGTLADTDEHSEDGRRLRPGAALPMHAFLSDEPLSEVGIRTGRLGPFLPERPPRG